jgi:hypothetical protein
LGLGVWVGAMVGMVRVVAIARRRARVKRRWLGFIVE